jgi:hypothetical protein
MQLTTFRLQEYNSLKLISRDGRRGTNMEEAYFDEMFPVAPITVDQFEAAIRGQLRVYFEGHVKDLQLTPKELAVFNQAKALHYFVEEPGKDRLGRMYYQYCVAMKTYWISIRLHANAHDNCNLGEDHANFQYDLFLIRSGLTPKALKTFQRHFERARPGAYEFTEIQLGEVWGRAIVPEYTAEKLARALVEVLNDSGSHSNEIFIKTTVIRNEQQSE